MSSIEVYPDKQVQLPPKEKEKEKKKIYFQILKEIKELPPFPAYILAIKQMLDDPKISIMHIAEIIKKDVSLAAEVLKIANSARFMFGKRVSTIEDAIKLIGFKELRHIMMYFGARKIIEDRYQNIELVWNHSYRTAFFAKTLVKVISKNYLGDTAYLCGLIHDMGKMALLHLSPELMEKITNLKDTKGISINYIERLALGINHAEVGGLMAEKWNYPPELVQTTTYHHEPLLGDEKYKDLTYTIYLANMIDMIINDQGIKYKDLEIRVLEHFKLEEETKFNSVMTTLTQLYENVKQENEKNEKKI